MAFDVLWIAPLSLLSGAFAIGAAEMGWNTNELEDAIHAPGDDLTFEQTRSRIVVRVTPFGSQNRDPQRQAVTQLRPLDGKSEECLALADVAGVRLGQGRLLLFMRDRRIYSANFERSCPVESFYSGFYVERPSDGRICAGREELHARSGADCTLSSFRGMTAED
ncbi:hypothetical protein [uncultured Croceicoccus sp.]|uniref:hypothetical protein n=1 Tax=uncultured Croceicoccus sp. TaxID=1295329 RepID=UPI00261D9AE3|nr:hypothetical protein [uncultured Croceicoccus sp.]